MFCSCLFQVSTSTTPSHPKSKSLCSLLRQQLKLCIQMNTDNTVSTELLSCAVPDEIRSPAGSLHPATRTLPAQPPRRTLPSSSQQPDLRPLCVCASFDQSFRAIILFWQTSPGQRCCCRCRAAKPSLDCKQLFRRGLGVSAWLRGGGSSRAGDGSKASFVWGLELLGMCVLIPGGAVGAPAAPLSSQHSSLAALASSLLSQQKGLRGADVLPCPMLGWQPDAARSCSLSPASSAAAAEAQPRFMESWSNLGGKRPLRSLK